MDATHAHLVELGLLFAASGFGSHRDRARGGGAKLDDFLGDADVEGICNIPITSGLERKEQLTMEKISRVAAIKRYFEADGGRKVEMKEMQALTKEDREYLAAEAAKQLGVELDTPVQS